MKHSLALVLVPALLLGGCYIESDPDHDYEVVHEEPAYRDRIDTDALMAPTNAGTGLHIEYASGGLWTLYATCSEVAEYGDCEWDIVTTVVEGGFVGAEGLDLEPGEFVQTDDVGAWTIVYTGSDMDGMYLQTTPGAVLQVDALLDGYPVPEYMFWVRHGNDVSYAPSNPIELVPSAP